MRSYILLSSLVSIYMIIILISYQVDWLLTFHLALFPKCCIGFFHLEHIPLSLHSASLSVFVSMN